MKPIIACCLFLLIFCGFSCYATTWDEPWMAEVIKSSDSFVLARVIKYDENKGVTINIINTLNGKPLTGQITITDFYLLKLCSRSGNEGPEFHFKGVDSCFFFIKKNKENNYCIATPTTGFAPVKNNNVAATYLHSYRQARVQRGIYEETMTAIFKHDHNEAYDRVSINKFVSKYLSQKPAGFGPGEIDIFFNQHVALECIYHLNLPGYYEKIIPFLNDTANVHSQVSAARALISCNTPACKQKLLAIVSSKNSDNFLKVMSIRALGTFRPAELKSRLEKIQTSASDEETGFGGNFMDPRVCTHVPSVKSALTQLIKEI